MRAAVSTLFSPQFKAQMMLLEAQLEKQSDQREAMEELEQVHHWLKKKQTNFTPDHSVITLFSSIKRWQPKFMPQKLAPLFLVAKTTKIHEKGRMVEIAHPPDEKCCKSRTISFYCLYV